MELFIAWLIIGALVKGAADHATGKYRASRDAHMKQAQKKAGGKLPKSEQRVIAARHATGWWLREAGRGFPALRTGWHTGWIAHKTALARQRVLREEARTEHAETQASFRRDLKEHRRRQAAARAELERQLAEDQAKGSPATGKRAARRAADEVAAKRAERERREKAAIPVPTSPGQQAAHDDRLHYACGGCGAHAGIPCLPGCTDPSGRAKHSPMPERDRPSDWLRPGESPCGGCGGSGRNEAGNDACPACRGFGSAPADPNSPSAGPDVVCGACGRTGTPDDPVLAAAGGYGIHRSHAREQTAAYRDAMDVIRARSEPGPDAIDASEGVPLTKNGYPVTGDEPGPDASRSPQPIGANGDPDDYKYVPCPDCGAPAGQPCAPDCRYDPRQGRDNQPSTTTASPTTTEGAPPVSDITYDNVIATAKSQVAHADAAGSDLRAQLAAAEQAAEGMQAANVDASTLSAQLDHVDALRAAVRAVDAVGESAGNVENTTARNHGGINEAHQSAPVKAAESGFYEG